MTSNEQQRLHPLFSYVECGEATCGVHYDLEKAGALSQDYGLA